MSNCVLKVLAHIGSPGFWPTFCLQCRPPLNVIASKLMPQRLVRPSSYLHRVPFSPPLSDPLEGNESEWSLNLHSRKLTWKWKTTCLVRGFHGLPFGAILHVTMLVPGSVVTLVGDPVQVRNKSSMPSAPIGRSARERVRYAFVFHFCNRLSLFRILGPAGSSLGGLFAILWTCTLYIRSSCQAVEA